MIWAVVGSGQSLKTEDLEYIKGKCRVAVVSDVYKQAPWADILVSHDRKWWKFHPDALNFNGDKYCRLKMPGTKSFKSHELPLGCNSGLYAMLIVKSLGASKILLLGLDMHGSHYFGKHPVHKKNGVSLTNTTQRRFSQHIKQFASWDGCKVINCTPGSHLTQFPKMDLREVI